MTISALPHFEGALIFLVYTFYMFFSIELLDFVLFCLQQLGIMLAVGAETIVLINYILAMRDNVVSDKEVRFSKIIHRTILFGLSLIVLSGIPITIIHSMMGEATKIAEPVFLFKWLLVAVLVMLYVWQHKKTYSQYFIEGAIGGTWYALFMIHILAPITTWFNLFTLYLVFLSGFMLIWGALASLSRKKEQKQTPVVTPKPVVTTTPPLAPKVSAPLPPPIVKPVAPKIEVEKVVPLPPMPVVLPPAPAPVVQAPVAPPAPVVVPMQAPVAVVPAVVEPHDSHWLPAIHVMPKDQKQLEDKSHITPLAAVNKPI